jgi:hypothetical protein
MTKRKRRRTDEERADWRCYLCGRNAAEIGVHPLPVQQQAHLLPNRLAGGLRRFGGVKNPFSDTEWQAFLKALGPELRADLGCDADVRETATAHCYELCGECHEEVLSEPVYLPSVMRALQKHFKGASRVEKVVVLARMLKRGAEALELGAES